MWRLFSYLGIYCKCLSLIKRIRKSIKWAIRVLFPCWNLTVVGLKDSFHSLSLLQQMHHSPFWAGFIHSHDYFSGPNTPLSISWIRESPTVFTLAGSFLSPQKAHDACWSDGDWALFPLLGPGLEVLQGVQRGVVSAQWIRHRWFAEGLLEDGLLQLHDEPIGLLTLRFPLLGCLSPKKGTLKFMYTSKHPEMIWEVV